MEPKKISFGFKLAAKPSLLAVKQKEPPKESKELIKCLEGQEIKLLVEKKDAAPLVIPMIGTQKTSAALASLMKRRAVLLGEDENPELETTQPKIADDKDNENLDKRAARELLAQVNSSNNETNDHDKLVLPILKADDLPLDGAKEATIDDYDSIPIQQFGLAMLRGMGWIEPLKKKVGVPADDAPFLRPKGMGLGADKALKAKPLLVQPAANEILEIKKLAYVRILGGKHKDAYGQIEGFDDHAGRVIVKMAIGSSKETFNEFMCLPVSKKEYTQYGKCINTTKYEEYKKLENEHGQIIIEAGKTRNANKTNKDDIIKGKDLDMKDVSTRKYEDEEKKYKNEQRRTYKNEEAEERYQSRRDVQSSSRKRNDHSSSSSVQRYRDEQKNEGKKVRSSRSPVRHFKPEAKAHRDSRLSSSIEESTDNSNSTKSDTDSAYERKHKRKSSSKSKKHKSKKSKSKNRHRRSDSTVEDHGSYISDSDKSERKHSKSKHKKKSKKSKRARSRSRSRSRR